MASYLPFDEQKVSSKNGLKGEASSEFQSVLNNFYHAQLQDELTIPYQISVNEQWVVKVLL